MMYLRVANWSSFQHYKDRNPAWVKLHKSLLDDFDFQCLPLASRALAPMIWLLASEYKDPAAGLLEYNLKKIAFRLRVSVDEIEGAIKPLIESGFLEVVQDASAPLAEVERDASPEEERETEEEREKEKEGEENAPPCGDATPAADDGRGREAPDAPALPSPAKPPPQSKPKTERAERLKAFLGREGEGDTAQAWGRWALEQGLSAEEINAEMQVFCDYWHAQPGQKGVKLDWPATWRNWVRRTVEKKQREEERRAVYRK